MTTSITTENCCRDSIPESPPLPFSKPEQHDSLLLILASGPDDGGKRATLALSAACTAVALGRTTRLFLIGDGAYWAHPQEGRVAALPGFPPLELLFDEFTELGGEIFLCSACDSICAPESQQPRRRGLTVSGFASVLWENGRGNSICF